MEKKNRFPGGGLQRKTVLLVLSLLLTTILVFAAVSFYQNRMLVRVVGETRTDQQQAISGTSERTMHGVLESALVRITDLQAEVADNDFAEVISCTRMLQTMAQSLFENRASITPATPSLPDPALDGVPSAMVLCEEGVDYTASESLGIAAHMSASMIAMFSNSEKLDGCYIGLADGTHFGVDDDTLNRYDESGRLIPFPVRERPWYRGAAETGDLFFTGLERDAFSGTPGITCSAPVIVDGELVGVVGVDIILDNMASFIRLPSSNSVYVINDSAQVILSSDGGAIFSPELPDGSSDLRDSENADLARIVETALREETGLVSVTIDGKDYYMVGAPMPSAGWAVLSVVDRELTERPEAQLLAEYDKINESATARFREGTAKTNRTFVVVLVMLAAAATCTALLAAGRIVRPVEEMTRSITECAQTGDPFEMKDCYRTNDEIEVLAEAFDDLSTKTRQYIADITAITKEKERVSTELELAGRIQAGMLPHIFPPYPDRQEFDIYAVMDPAREVGGDFYDFFLIDDDHLCLIMADVSGKGIPGALFMMASMIVLKSVAMLGRSPAEILSKANEALCSDTPEQMFVTVWLGILELSTGTLTAANAGHEYPIIMEDGRFSLLRDKHGFVIGGMAGSKYTEYKLHLRSGDRLFLYTDGVPEASDAECRMFGTQRLLDALNADPGAAPGELLNNVRRAVDAFVSGAEQFDDLTMLCIQYKGLGRSAADPESSPK